MKTILIPILLLLLGACTHSEKKGVANAEKKVFVGDYWKDHHCMRSKPTTTLDTSKVSNYKFELQKDRAIEEAILSNGDKITIMNEGCEVYWLSYTYYINNYDQRNTNLDLVIQAFSKTKSYNIAPIDFDKALAMLQKIKKGGGRIKLGNEYFLKMDSVSEMFEIDEISLKKEYAAVDFSFAIGKL